MLVQKTEFSFMDLRNVHRDTQIEATGYVSPVAVMF